MPPLSLAEGEIEAEMFLDRLFRPKPAQIAGRALYASVVAQSRTPAFYLEFGAQDTPTGRFEVYSLHVVLLLDRLKRNGPAAADTAQALFDTYVRSLDDALRELGVGDLSVGKKMRKLGEAFYGRVKSYQDAFAALPDETELTELLGRTIYADASAAAEPRLRAYVLAQKAALAALPLDGFLAGEVQWASPSEVAA